MFRMSPEQRKAKRDLRKACRELGAEFGFERVGDCVTLTVTCPAGMRFENEDIHQFVSETFYPFHPDYADTLDRLRQCPPVECDDAECEWCRPPECDFCHKPECHYCNGGK